MLTEQRKSEIDKMIVGARLQRGDGPLHYTQVGMSTVEEEGGGGVGGGGEGTTLSQAAM